MSEQAEGIKLVRLAAMQIQHLSPQVNEDCSGAGEDERRVFRWLMRHEFSLHARPRK